VEGRVSPPKNAMTGKTHTSAVRALARGRHELRIAHPPHADPEQDEGDPGYDSIPIWK